MSEKHTPARQCPVCEGFCLQPATIDEANTAMAVAKTRTERLFACEALVEAAQRTVIAMRNAEIANYDVKRKRGAA